MLKYDVQVMFGKKIALSRFDTLSDAKKFHYQLINLFNQSKPKDIRYIRLYKVYVQKVREIQSSVPIINTIYWS